MNFLQLAQKLAQECEVPSAGPTDVTTQTGQLKRIVDWTADAYNDIQNRSAVWRWMRRAFTFNTVADDDSYPFTAVTDVDAGAAISRFGHWWAHDEKAPPLAYLQSGGVAGQYRLVWMPWDEFRWIYRFGTQNASTPIYVSVDHQNNLCLGPKPNDVFVVTGDFQRSAQQLAANGDIPEMPRFHDLIVYTAMVKYGANSVAAETVARGELESKRLLSALENDQLPTLSLGGPLV
jgi:hypothetical protein